MASNNALIKAAQAGNSQAQNELVKENIAYIKKIVGSIPNLNQSYYDDLVQEGCLGLLKAIEKFDINRNTEFLTYASSWIKKYISDGLAKMSYHIQIPAYLRTRYLKIISFVNRYFAEENTYPTIEEISEETGIPCEQLEDKSKFPIILFYNATAVNNNDDREITFLDTLSDDEDIQDWAAKEDMKREIHKALQTLDTRSREVLILTYGLEGESAHTYDEIGKTFNLSRQRVEQILKSAKKQLRDNPTISNSLRVYMTA